MEKLAIPSFILNIITLVLLTLFRLNIIKPRSSPKARMKERIKKKLNRLLNADKNSLFIPVGELGDTLIQKHNPIFRMRFCEIFLESIRELDEKEIMIIDRGKIPISLEVGKPIEYPPKYDSTHFTYGSLRRISPDQYIGLNNAESREYIKSIEEREQWHSQQYINAY